MSADDIMVLVQGEDWDGNPVTRAARPGMSTCLRGKAGEGFDIHGPHVTLCPECGAPLFVPGGHTSAALQRHLWEEHSVTAGLLGNGH